MNTFKVWCPEFNISYNDAALVEAESERHAALKWAKEYDSRKNSSAFSYRDAVKVFVCARNKPGLIVIVLVSSTLTFRYSAGFYTGE